MIRSIKVKRVWFLDPQAVLIIGKLFTEGKYVAEKIIAFAGSGSK
ncbi:MAG: hypothetical protein R2759_03650 [Bacteroidales bacterium]